MPARDEIPVPPGALTPVQQITLRWIAAADGAWATGPPSMKGATTALVSAGLLERSRIFPRHCRLTEAGRRKLEATP